MSRSPRPSPRSRVVALALAVVALLGACSHVRQIPDSYGETTERNFLRGCVETMTQRGPEPGGATEADLGGSEPVAEEQAQAICTCSYEQIVEDISFERFREINEELESEPGPLPDEILSIVDGCRDANPA